MKRIVLGVLLLLTVLLAALPAAAEEVLTVDATVSATDLAYVWQADPGDGQDPFYLYVRHEGHGRTLAWAAARSITMRLQVVSRHHVVPVPMKGEVRERLLTSLVELSAAGPADLTGHLGTPPPGSGDEYPLTVRPGAGVTVVVRDPAMADVAGRRVRVVGVWETVCARPDGGCRFVAERVDVLAPAAPAVTDPVVRPLVVRYGWLRSCGEECFWIQEGSGLWFYLLPGEVDTGLLRERTRHFVEIAGDWAASQGARPFLRVDRVRSLRVTGGGGH